MSASTDASAATAPKSAQPAPRKPLINVHPLAWITAGALLIAGGALTAWLEQGPVVQAAAESPAAQEERQRRMQERNLQRAREREAQARAEQERLAAEAAVEKARLGATLIDGTAEALARAQREELARKQAAVEAAHREAAASEEAWKRYYKPSANCRDTATATTVECINEYVKAKREFESRRAPKQT